MSENVVIALISSGGALLAGAFLAWWNGWLGIEAKRAKEAREHEAAHSGRVDHRFRSKPIGDSGMSITSERSDAGCGLLG